jgi:hypothetical protein
VSVLDNRLGHTSGEFLAQPPDRLADLSSGWFRPGERSLDLIEPSVKVRMELLA